MSDNMERIRSEIASTIHFYFDKDFLDNAFSGEIKIDEFVDEVLVEFIKYEFDNSQEEHSLRYYLNYSEDSNADERMRYSRVIDYSQKYRNREYEYYKNFGIEIEGLKAKPMLTMREKLDGHDLTPMHFLELTTLLDIAVFKSYTEKRLMNIKKVSNLLFEEMMVEYDQNVKMWSEARDKSDYNMVFYSLAFFTVEWCYGFEFAYLMAKKMEQLKIKEIDKNIFLILSSKVILFFSSWHLVDVESRMVKLRQRMIDVLIPSDLKWTDKTEWETLHYKDLLIIMKQLKDGGKFKLLREKFVKETTIEDWASFFKDYDIFGVWNKKEFSSTRIRNMRKVLSQLQR